MRQCWWHKKINFFTHFVEELVPRHCLFCLQKTDNQLDLCASCIADLGVNSQCCQRCALPLENLSEQPVMLCGNCLSHRYFYDNVFSPFRYSEDIAHLIKNFKYHKKIHYAVLLVKLFIEKNKNNNKFQLPELIIPVPMHRQRLKSRGYNQALELARIFASHYQLPVDYSSLIRHRYTDLQVGMNRLKRQKNVKNAFLMNKPINNSHIALIDDVMTTGSTVNEVAKVLKEKGIERVDVWTIARAGSKY